ncbi:uroporphyrinogen-III C-methyltransferase, partial [Enterobacter cloacae complex sp. 742-ADZ3-9B]
ETYRQALENVSTWVRAYYDTDDATTKAFLDEVDQLSQQNISMDLPETLQSQAMLEKLMQTRVRNLLAQPAAGATEAKPAPAPAPAPAPQADTPAAAPQGE